MKTRVLFVALAIVSAGASYAQNKVNGTVIDRTDNSKLIGVNVTLSNDSGQVAGTTTDNNGKFTLNAEKGDYILELSYIGYETIRMALTVNDNTHIGTIQMQEGATELGEVVVESQAIIQKVDRQILLPSKEQMQASSDGVSLLQNLQIPRIVISPIDNSVKTLSDESVQLRINGIEASTADVKAINPKDIIRVEYHDQPGVRYNGAAAVVDYIVRKRDNGGSLMLASTNGITLSGVGNYYLAGKVHFGKSSIQAVASYSPNDVFWNRSNNEIYNFSTGSVVNEEIGNPVRTKNHPVNVTLNYNWTNGDKNMLNIRLRNNMAHTPYAATDRDTRLYQATDSFTIKDHESSQSQSPSLDIYYQHNLTNKQHIYLDVVGTYISSHSNRRFQQTPLGATLADTTDAYSSVKGNKYSLIGEAIYEKEWEKIMLTVGARHNQQWVQNSYLSRASTTVNMTTAETYAFAEMRHRVDKFSYVVGIGAMHTLIEQGGQKQSTWIARPQLTMSYDFGKGWFWKYKGFVSGYQPSLSELSDVSQQIDKYQIRRGNPNLKPVIYVSNEMELSWQNKYVNLNIWANYSYDHKPIMDDTFEEIVDGKAYAIRTYDNQRGFHRLRISPSVQVKLLKNKLMFNVTPFINYAVSQGNNYEHRHFNPGLRAGIFYLLKGLRFYMDVVTYQDNLWGETLTHGEISHDIGIKYNYKLRDSSKTRLYGVTDLGFGVMMVNPFLMRGQTTTSKDLSALAPSEQVAVMPDYRQVLMLNFNVSLDFGSKHRERGKRIDNEDNETGILSGAK
ncbi:MAG: TonB-dependent receptor [Paludibacteraceae bacterium]|nr:TonB-dependent receptor [Paludibacteraceae bacterium]